MNTLASNTAIKGFSMRMRARPKRRNRHFMPDQVWLDEQVAHHPQALRILNNLPGVAVDIVNDVKQVKAPHRIEIAKHHLLITKQTPKLQAHPALQVRGVSTLRSIELINNSPIDCSYCPHQLGLASAPIPSIAVNTEEILSQIARLLKRYPERHFRFSTGESSDSLFYDHLTEFSSGFIRFFAEQSNAILELKTKTANIAHLLHLNHNERTVISWSLNTPSLIRSEERKSVSLDERLFAAQKAAHAGFKIAFQFEPIVITHSVEQHACEYLAIIDKIFSMIPSHNIAWMSFGLLQYPKGADKVAQERFPESNIFAGELVPIKNLMRYPRFVREECYRYFWNHLARKLPLSKIHFFGESPEIWKKFDAELTDADVIANRLCQLS